MEDFVTAKLKHNTKTQIFFFKINLNYNYKKEQKFTKIKERERERERERESTHSFCVEKNMDWMEEMISNLYKIKWEGKELNYKKEKMMNEV